MQKTLQLWMCGVLWLILVFPVWSQCPQPSFTIPDTVCINEPFSITNSSTGAIRYEWDFCSGDLAETPTVTELLTVPGASSPAEITTVSDGVNWFGFFFSRDNNLLFRLDFGNSLLNVPVLVNVGNLGSPVNRPEPMAFVQEEGNWYAFTANSIGNSNLIRLNFGTLLTNTPTVADLTNFGGILNIPRGLKIEKVNGDYIAVITNWGDNTIALINFGNSVVNTLSSSQIRKTSPFPGVNNQLIHTAIVNDCGNWYGITSSFGNNSLYKLNFGNSLFNIPSVTNLTNTIPTIATPTIVKLVKELGYIGIIATGSGSLVRLDFGNSMTTSTPVVTNFGDQGVSSMFSLTLDRVTSEWIAFTINNNSNKLYKIRFSAPCTASTAASEEAAPANISFSEAGMRRIYYEEQLSATEKVMFFDSVYVRPAPAIDFKTQAGSNIFQAQYPAGSGFTTFTWNFGDGTTANGNPVQHTFPNNGNYEVTLTIQDVCGQSKSISKTVGVFDNSVLQCPRALFDVPDTVCINEPVSIVNQTIGAIKYAWDYCSGDLNTASLLQTISTISGAAVPSDITTVFDGSNWVSFVCSRNNNSIIRLNYGATLSNIPMVTNLGNISGLFSFPNGIKIFKEGANWYGLVVNILGNRSNNLLKLDFGTNLTNIPAVSNISSVSSILDQPRGIDLVYEQENLIVAIANYNGKRVTLINFGKSINNPPSSSDINTVTGFQDELAKITLQKYCGNWHAFVIGTYVYRLDFGSNLMLKPEVNNITANLTIEGVSNIKFYLEKDINAIAVTRFGKVYHLNFGNELTTNTVSIKNIATIGVVNDLESLELLHMDSGFLGLMVDWSSNNLAKLTYSNNCNSTALTSTDQQPVSLTYDRTGWNLITLTAYDSNGNLNSYTDSVFVRPPIPVDFIATYLCEGTATEFAAPVAAVGNRAKAWYWEFGDGFTSSEENPAHLFSTPGTKNVKLTITDVCNKTATISKEITIYQNSVPDFTIPSEICSSQFITFIEISLVKDDTTIAWEWDFGNGDKSTEREPVYAFLEPGNFTVTLTITGKSGCKTSIPKAIQVKPGAQVNFSVQNACLGNETRFADLTQFSGETVFVSRLWEFGDGETSQLANPVHTYQAAGKYTVTLTVQNTIGCSVSYSRTIEVTLLPQPAFSFSLACADEAISFFDETVAPQGQIVAWEWSFGEAENGAANFSDQQNPTYIFAREGEYTVKLKVYTSYGCADSVSREVKVIASPKSNFTYQLNCDSKEVSFIDQSVVDADNPVTDWYWDFGDGNTSLLQQPVHTYITPGEYTVTLVTTALSRCTNSYSRSVQVNSRPVADFTMSGLLCINNTLVFTDKSVVDAADHIVSREWDFGVFGRSNAEQPSVNFTSATAVDVQVSLKITTFAGCQAIVSKSISLQPSPAVTFTHQSPSLLSPLQIQFASQVTGDAIKYFWDFGDGQRSEQKNPIHIYEQSGTYTVVFTAENTQGCQTTYEKQITVSTVSDDFQLKLEHIEVISISGMLQVTVYILNNSPLAIQQLTFFTRADTQNEIQTNWQGSLLPGRGIKHSYTIPVSNSASICVLARETSRNITSNRQCAGLQEKVIALEPYPNPARTTLRQPFILPAKGTVEIRVTDILGQQFGVFFTGVVNSGFNEIPLQVAHLKPGIYFIQCKAGGAVFSKKVLIQ